VFGCLKYIILEIMVHLDAPYGLACLPWSITKAVSSSPANWLAYTGPRPEELAETAETRQAVQLALG